MLARNGAVYGTSAKYGSVVWYQWQLVYDSMLARDKIGTDAAARGGRGVEHVASMNHLDSWDVLGEWGMHVHEIEHMFTVPLKAR